MEPDPAVAEPGKGRSAVSGGDLSLTGEIVDQSDVQIAIRVGLSTILIDRGDVRSMVRIDDGAGRNVCTLNVSAGAKLIQQVSTAASLGIAAGVYFGGRGSILASQCSECSVCACACNCACNCACACACSGGSIIRDIAASNAFRHAFRNQVSGPFRG